MELISKYKMKLKQEMSAGRAFILLTIAFVSLSLFILWIAKPYLYGLFMLGALLIGVCLIYIIYIKMLSDIILDIKEVNTYDVQTNKWEKQAVKDVEAGSGAMFIPVLGHLFPQLWGQKMRGVYRYYLTTDGHREQIDKGVYDELIDGDTIHLVYAKKSNVFLGINTIP